MLKLPLLYEQEEAVDHIWLDICAPFTTYAKTQAQKDKIWCNKLIH